MAGEHFMRQMAMGNDGRCKVELCHREHIIRYLALDTSIKKVERVLRKTTRFLVISSSPLTFLPLYGLPMLETRVKQPRLKFLYNYYKTNRHIKVHFLSINTSHTPQTCKYFNTIQIKQWCVWTPFQAAMCEWNLLEPFVTGNDRLVYC